jgi:hypothetical protein
VDICGRHIPRSNGKPRMKMGDRIVEDCWQTAITVRPVLLDIFAKLRRVTADLQDENDENEIQDFAA